MDGFLKFWSKVPATLFVNGLIYRVKATYIAENVEPHPGMWLTVELYRSGSDDTLRVSVPWQWLCDDSMTADLRLDSVLISKKPPYLGSGNAHAHKRVRTLNTDL